MTDYRNLIAAASMDHGGNVDPGDWEFFLADAQAILATRVPDLCPDCKGSGRRACDCHERDDPEAGIVDCFHPNAPTISDLLRWGINVAKAKVDYAHEGGGGCAHLDDRCFWADDVALLAALRTEADQ